MKDSYLVLALCVACVILGAVFYHGCLAPTIGSKTYDTLFVDRWHEAITSPPETLYFDQDTAYVADKSGIEQAIRETHDRDSLLYWMMSPWYSHRDTVLSIGLKNDTSKVILSAHVELLSFPRTKKNEMTLKVDSLRIPEKIITITKVLETLSWSQAGWVAVTVVAIEVGGYLIYEKEFK